MYRLIVKSVFFASLTSAIFLTATYLLWPEIFLLISAIILLCISTISFLILRPPTYKEQCEAKGTFRLQGVGESDVWIFIAEECLYVPWYNAVSKEIGPCRLISKISGNTRPRLMVLPQGSKPAESEIEIMTKWVNAGTALLFECPDVSLINLSGLQPSEQKYNCFFEKFLEKGIDLKGARCLSYFASFREENQGKNSQIFFENRIGRGVVFSISIDYAKWVCNLTQGMPNSPGGSFHKKIGWDLQGIQTSDLRTDCPQPFSFTPVVDIFDQTLFGYIRDRLRIPSWWYYPDAKPCAFILSFDEDWFGKRLKRFPLPAIPATWFVVDDSDIDAESVDYIHKNTGTLQLHWNRFIIHLNKFGWHFCFRKAKEQAGNLFKKTKTQPDLCRIHYLRWDSDLSNLFFVMKEAGIKFDSSFGPGRGQHGYRFGTGFPYFVSDKKGDPIGVQEISFQIHDPMSGASLEDYIKLLEDAENNYHTAVVALFHPYYCLPGRRSYESYRKLLDFLSTKKIWCANLEQLINFWNKRLKSEISSSLNKQELIINVSKSQNEQMSIRLPDVRNIERVILDEIEVPVRDNLVLSPRNHIVRIRYRS